MVTEQNISTKLHWLCDEFVVYLFVCLIFPFVHLTLCVQVRVRTAHFLIRHLSSPVNPDNPANPNDFINSNLFRISWRGESTRTDYRQRIEKKRTSVVNALQLFSYTFISVVFFILCTFCSIKWLTCQYLSDCSYFFSLIIRLQIRHRFGLYDEISISNGFRVRHCNWVRFLRVSKTYGPQVRIPSYYSLYSALVLLVCMVSIRKSIDKSIEKASVKYHSTCFDCFNLTCIQNTQKRICLECRVTLEPSNLNE